MPPPKLILFICILTWCQIGTGQSKRMAHWYFGHEAGLDFNSGVAVRDINGKTTSIEGSAAISDLSGNLLFYTDGIKVWNRNHTLMPNGQDLLGDQSSTQSSLIVPMPGNNDIYYLFTSSMFLPPGGIFYSTIDMRLDGGLGDVTTKKNIELFAPASEQLAGTMHCNGKDYWIVSRQAMVNKLKFYTYLLTNNGLSAPIIAEFNAPAPQYGAIGDMTFTVDGSMMALCTGTNELYLFDFDIQTGQFTLKTNIQCPQGDINYSNAFSSDKTKLYITSWNPLNNNYLSQFDLTATNVAASRVNLDSIDYRFGSPNGFGRIGQIRLAPDQKIYVSRWDVKPVNVHPDTYYALDSLDVIHTPNLPGLACQHQRNSLYLDHKPTMIGLPNFISNFTAAAPPLNTCQIDPSKYDFSFTGECQGTVIDFLFIQPPEINSIKWEFGDPANSSTALTPSHDFSRNGQFEVKLILFHNNGTDTVTKMVRTGKVDVFIGNDTLICGEANYLVQSSAVGNTSLLWQDGSTSVNHTATQSGTYWLEAKDDLSGCFKRDSIDVSLQPYPNTNLGSDINACEGSVQILQANIQADQYTWSNGSTNNSISVSQSGTYWLDLTENGCTKRDSLQVTFHPYPIVDLGLDTMLCNNETLILQAGHPNAVWQDNSQAETYTVTTPGKYYSTVTENGCEASDTVIVQYNYKPIVSLDKTLTICEGQQFLLQPLILNNTSADYLWQDGSTDTSYLVKMPGLFTVQASNACGSTIESILVEKGNCEFYVPNAFSPNGDGKNEVFRPKIGNTLVTFRMTVFNRWGQKVFETTDVQKGWDGTFNGMKQPQGLYVWTLQYHITPATTYKLKGTVTLIY